jgi:hypothetical protein
MKRLVPFLPLHRAFPVDSLRVRWVPLFPSFQRLGAFAIRPYPGVPRFSGLRLLCPLRLLCGHRALRWALASLLSTALRIPHRSPVFTMKDSSRMLEVAWC